MPNNNLRLAGYDKQMVEYMEKHFHRCYNLNMSETSFINSEAQTFPVKVPEIVDQRTTADLIIRELPTHPENGIGGVILGIKDQIESGVNFDRNGVQVSTEKELVPLGLVDVDPNSIKDQSAKDAFDRATSIKSEGENIKLVEQSGKLMVQSEQTIEDIKVIEIYDANLPQTARYEDYLTRKASSQLTIDEQNLGFAIDSRKKEDFSPVQNLIIVDTSNGNAFDFRSMLPADWKLLNYIYGGDKYFSQEFKDKTISFGKIQSKEDLVKLFHEFGHTIFSANDDPEIYQQAITLWEESAGQLGGLKNLPSEIFGETVKLLGRNERGASARGLELIKILKQKGLDLKIDIQRQIEIVEGALETYRKGFGVTKTKFK